MEILLFSSGLGCGMPGEIQAQLYPSVSRFELQNGDAVTYLTPPHWHDGSCRGESFGNYLESFDGV
jgi:hypothetical protein